MRTSTEIKNITTALLKAQKQIESVDKNAKNPFFKSDYADLNSVIEAVQKPLNDNGIVLLQPVMNEVVETTLFHAESGEYITGETKIINAKANDPQAQGSAITYARRYGLMSMLALRAEDDDGEKAMDRKATPTTPEAKPTAVKLATPKQQEYVAKLWKDKTGQAPSQDKLRSMTLDQASKYIEANGPKISYAEHTKAQKAPSEPVSEALRKAFFASVTARGLDTEEEKELLKAKYELESFNDATNEQVNEFIVKDLLTRGGLKKTPEDLEEIDFDSLTLE